MRVDVRVSRIKFDEEVERLNIQSETLKKRGVVIQKIAFPIAEVIFIPRSKLKLSLPAQPPSTAIIRPNQQYYSVHEVPNLAARAFGTRISLDDFDQRAPSVVFCDPFTWEELPFEKLHRGNHIGEDGKSFAVILGHHPISKKPFLCMRGIREYHEHPQHTGDDWMQYRKHVGLFSTIDTIWKTCIRNANPVMIFQQQDIKINWTPEAAF